MNKKLFGAEAKKKRVQRGFTQESFAEFMELDKNVISNLERGYKLPNRDNLFKIATELNLSLDKYLDIDDLKSNSKILLIIEKYNDLPRKKQLAIEKIFLEILDEIKNL